MRAISQSQNEPDWMLQHRLKSLEIFNSMPMPSRGPSLDGLNLNEIVYYAKPSQDSE